MAATCNRPDPYYQLRNTTHGPSVPELYELLGGAQLELIEFTSFFTSPPIRRFMYDPMAWISDLALADHIRAMPGPRQQAIAEAMCCVLICHGFYAAPKRAHEAAGIASVGPA